MLIHVMLIRSFYCTDIFDTDYNSLEEPGVPGSTIVFQCIPKDLDLDKTVTVTRRPTTISWLIPFAVKFLKQKRYIYIHSARLQ